jgi:hypothetical protein
MTPVSIYSHFIPSKSILIVLCLSISIISTYTDPLTTQLHRQGEEPIAKGAYMVRMITSPTHLRTAQ